MFSPWLSGEYGDAINMGTCTSITTDEKKSLKKRFVKKKRKKARDLVILLRNIKGRFLLMRKEVIPA
ncbi:hypothetical protein ACJX0J_023276, partial [Zea mays]